MNTLEIENYENINSYTEPMIITIYKIYPSQIKANKKYRENNLDKIREQRKNKLLKIKENETEYEELKERERLRALDYYNKKKIDPAFMEKQRNKAKEYYKRKQNKNIIE